VLANNDNRSLGQIQWLNIKRNQLPRSLSHGLQAKNRWTRNCSEINWKGKYVFSHPIINTTRTQSPLPQKIRRVCDAGIAAPGQARTPHHGMATQFLIPNRCRWCLVPRLVRIAELRRSALGNVPLDRSGDTMVIQLFARRRWPPTMKSSSERRHGDDDGACCSLGIVDAFIDRCCFRSSYPFYPEMTRGRPSRLRCAGVWCAERALGSVVGVSESEARLCVCIGANCLGDFFTRVTKLPLLLRRRNISQIKI
jgi:hypothetical protein